MSALPPKADMRELLDHLLGSGEQRLRHREADRLRSFAIDREDEFGRLLDRQLARPHTVEDLST